MVIFQKMKATKFQILFSGITIDVERKNIKNVYLRVYPPDGKVKLSSPRNVSTEALRQFVISREDWIRKKVRNVQSRVREPELNYISGESHFVWGDKYLLRVIEHKKPQRVEISSDGYLNLYVRSGSDNAKREKVLREWYRAILKEHIPGLISKWEPALRVSVSDWGVKKMKTRWGTCNTKAGRIWLNLELVKRPKQLLDYVVLHEMVHLKERLHNKRFRGYLDKHMPDWKQREEELKKRVL